MKNSLPIMHGSGLSAPKAALLMVNQGWNTELQVSVQSHANDAAGGTEVLVLDGEVQTLSALLQWKFSSRWQASIELFSVKNSAGSFDSLIDQWHDTFGLDQGDRDLFVEDQLRFEYTDSSERTALDRSATGLGDVELALSYQALANNRINLSLNTGLALGTGSARDWLGSDDADINVSVAMSSAGEPVLAWHANAGILFVGDKALFGARTESSVAFTSLGLHWQPSNNWRWTAQLDGHGAVFKSAIPELNKSAWQIALGLEYARRWQIHFTEDLSVNRAADFSLGIRYRWPF